MADPDDIKPAPPRKTFMAPPETALAEAKAPSFLWPWAGEIAPGNVVEVVHPDHAWFLRLYVREIDAEAREVRTHVILERQFRLN
jgi:hypothetical protein